MKQEIYYDKLYESNKYGKFKILEELNNDKNYIRYFKCQFIQTGTVFIADLSAINKGYVRDPYFPIYYGVACVGNVKNASSHILHNIWRLMIARCYDQNNKRYKDYGGIGVRVDSRWHCFEYFIYDCQFLYNYSKFVQEPYNYNLDKDYLQLNIPKEYRIYSKDTCLFLNKWDNINLRTIENKNKCSSKYYGVSKKTDSTYRAEYYMNGNNIIIGVFNNEIAAANAYNAYSLKYDRGELVKLINDVPYMSYEEAMNYMVSSERKLILNVN